MIIVEGPDGSGKTTLIKHLQSIATFYMYHSKGPVTDLKDGLMRTNALYTYPFNSIMDRCVLISEPIYGPIVRNIDIFDQHLTGLWQRLKEKIDPTIIMCSPPYDTAEENIKNIEEVYNKSWKTDDHLDLVIKKYKLLLIKYDDIYARLVDMKFNVLLYKYTYTKMDYLENYLLWGGELCAD